MLPLYRKCLLMLKEINEKGLPELDNAYRHYVNVVKTNIIISDCLNRSKSICIGSKLALESNKLDKPEIIKAMRRLEDLNIKIENGSRDLNDLLINTNMTFNKVKKNLHKKNLDYLNKIESVSDIPASELFSEIKKFALEIQKTITEEVKSYQMATKKFVTRLENDICPETEKIYKSIVKLDENSFCEGIPSKEWISVDAEWPYRNGAFMYNDYSDN